MKRVLRRYKNAIANDGDYSLFIYLLGTTLIGAALVSLCLVAKYDYRIVLGALTGALIGTLVHFLKFYLSLRGDLKIEDDIANELAELKDEIEHTCGFILTLAPNDAVLEDRVLQVIKMTDDVPEQDENNIYEWIQAASEAVREGYRTLADILITLRQIVEPDWQTPAGFSRLSHYQRYRVLCHRLDELLPEESESEE